MFYALPTLLHSRRKRFNYIVGGKPPSIDSRRLESANAATTDLIVLVLVLEQVITHKTFQAVFCVRIFGRIFLQSTKQTKERRAAAMYDHRYSYNITITMYISMCRTVSFRGNHFTTIAEPQELCLWPYANMQLNWQRYWLALLLL